MSGAQAFAGASRSEGRAGTRHAPEEAPRHSDALLEIFEPSVGRRVLEVGAGIGTFTERFARGDLAVATDVDEVTLSHLRRRFAGNPHVQVRYLDPNDVPVPELQPLALDTIFCANVLEHIEHDRGALVRLRESIAPGGALLLLVPAHEILYGTLDLHLDHFRRYEREPLRRLLESTGWTVESMRFFDVAGALGWLVNGRVLRKRKLSAGQIRLYDRLCAPLLRLEPWLHLPFGCSLAVVARRPRGSDRWDLSSTS